MDFSNYINNLEKKAAEQVTVNEVDYIGEDGLLYCGVCRTKKQTRIIFLGGRKNPLLHLSLSYQKTRGGGTKAQGA